MQRWLLEVLLMGFLAVELVLAQDNCTDDGDSCTSSGTVDTPGVMRTNAIITLPRPLKTPAPPSEGNCNKDPCCPTFIPEDLVDIGADRSANVTISNTVFAEDQYTSEDTGIQVCYPNSEEFLGCSQWLLEAWEVTLRQADLSLIQKETDQVYPLGNYAYNADRNEYWVCVPSDASLDNEFVVNSRPYLVGVCAMSEVCLLITFIVYLKSEEKLGNQKMMLLCHMGSLFLGFLMLCFRYTIDFSPWPALCETVALLTQYGLLSAFCWLSVLSAFSWRQFSNFGSMIALHDFKKTVFLYQCLFAWGFPLLLCAIGPIMDGYNVKHKPELDLYCWIHDYYAELYLFYLPSGILFSINYIFFGLTIYNIKRLTKEVHQVNPFMQKKMFRLTLKMIVVLGLCWIFEVISWVLGNNQKYWFIFDLINCLQGFFMFLIYINKGDTTRKINENVSKCWRKLTGRELKNSKGSIVARPATSRTCSTATSRTCSRATSVSSISAQSDVETGFSEAVDTGISGQTEVPT